VTKFHIRWSNGYFFFYYRKHPNTSLHLFVIDFTILDRLRTFRNIFLEKMWFCHLFSKHDIFKRSLNSLNYYYLIFLSRISTRFILYAFCRICIHTYEIKRNFCEKDIFYRITSLGVEYRFSKYVTISNFYEQSIRIALNTSFRMIWNLAVC
jgi:hypothetical protein